MCLRREQLRGKLAEGWEAVRNILMRSEYPLRKLGQFKGRGSGSSQLIW